jgi:hypothetical protein
MFGLGFVLSALGMYLVDCAVQNRPPIKTLEDIVQNPGGMRQTLADTKGTAYASAAPTYTAPTGSSSGGSSGSSGGGGTTGKPSKYGQGAIHWASHQVDAKTGGWHDRCLGFVTLAYRAAGAPVIGVGTALIAGVAAERTMHHNPDPSSIPPGVPLWWSGGLGHVALSLGGGKAISTDYPTSGVANYTTVDGLIHWLEGSHHFLGWSETIEGARVYG